MREKLTLGSWADTPLSALAKMKRLRGTRLDPFGRSEIRRTERALIVEYRELVDAALDALASGRIGADQLPAVVDLAELPDMVRGYEGIKMANVERYREAVARQREVLGI